jgi:predicted nuclease of predicted toxin-antitoxin system
VRILLDQNLSPKLIRRLADIIPGLETVYDHGLVGASDPYIFDWARNAEFAAVVSSD